MANKLTLTASFLLCFLTSFVCNKTFAQINLGCDGNDMHAIYLVDNSGYYRMDSVDTTPTNPILIAPNPMGFIGISINNNLDSIAGPLTMYSIGGGNNYHFWNGTGWTNTGHTSGSVSAVNPGGTSNFIFNFHDNGTFLYRYDGTGNGTLLLSNIPAGSTACIHDVATDNQGNFYLFFTNAQKILAYTPSGIPIDSFTTTGFPIGSNCGFTIVSDRLYGVTCSGTLGLYEGIKTGSNIHFTLIKPFSIAYIDIASCPNASLPLAVFKNPELPRFAVYPNPVRDAAMIKLNNTVTLEVYDYMGILKQAIPVRGLTEYYLDVSEWKAGVYFINAISANKSSAHTKIVVQ